MGEVQLALGNIDDAEYHAKFVILQNPNSREALRLFSNIKMRKNFIFGLWWRFNSTVAALSNIKGGLVLISAFVFFNLFSQIVHDLGYEVFSDVVGYTWIILVIYSWLGIPYYRKLLQKELDKFSFNANY